MTNEIIKEVYEMLKEREIYLSETFDIKKVSVQKMMI